MFAKEVALGLVRNIEYRKTAFDSTNDNIIDQHGNMRTLNKNNSSNETNQVV